MSIELLSLPDSAQELPREIETYSRARPGYFCARSFILGIQPQLTHVTP